jgi:hypothetical protein
MVVIRMTLTSEQIKVLLIIVLIILALDYIFIIAKVNSFIEAQRKLSSTYTQKILKHQNENVNE